MKNRVSRKIWLISWILASSLLADTFTDKETGLMWQDDVSVTTTKKDWHSAIAHCQNITHAGHSDWRLPTRMEHLSIGDKSKFKPAVKDGIKYVDITDVYWTRTTSVRDTTRAWFFHPKDGASYRIDKSASCLVRCVRDSK